MFNRVADFAVAAVSSAAVAFGALQEQNLPNSATPDQTVESIIDKALRDINAANLPHLPAPITPELLNLPLPILNRMALTQTTVTEIVTELDLNEAQQALVNDAYFVYVEAVTAALPTWRANVEMYGAQREEAMRRRREGAEWTDAEMFAFDLNFDGSTTKVYAPIRKSLEAWQNSLFDALRQVPNLSEEQLSLISHHLFEHQYNTLFPNGNVASLQGELPMLVLVNISEPGMEVNPVTFLSKINPDFLGDPDISRLCGEQENRLRPIYHSLLRWYAHEHAEKVGPIAVAAIVVDGEEGEVSEKDQEERVAFAREISVYLNLRTDLRSANRQFLMNSLAGLIAERFPASVDAYRTVCRQTFHPQTELKMRIDGLFSAAIGVTERPEYLPLKPSLTSLHAEYQLARERRYPAIMRDGETARHNQAERKAVALDLASATSLRGWEVTSEVAAGQQFSPDQIERTKIIEFGNDAYENYAPRILALFPQPQQDELLARTTPKTGGQVHPFPLPPK